MQSVEQQTRNLIESIYNKIARVKNCNLEPKSIILNDKNLTMLKCAFWAYNLSYTKPVQLLGLPVIVDNDIKEFQIGV